MGGTQGLDTLPPPLGPWESPESSPPLCSPGWLRWAGPGLGPGSALCPGPGARNLSMT